MTDLEKTIAFLENEELYYLDMSGAMQFRREQPTANMREIAKIAKIAKEQGMSFDEARKAWDAEHPSDPKKGKKLCEQCGSPIVGSRGRFCSKNCYQRHRRAQRGGERQRKSFTEDNPFDYELFAECYNKKMNDIEIAEVMGLSQFTARGRRYRYGLPTNSVRGSSVKRAKHGIKTSAAELKRKDEEIWLSKDRR